MVKLYNSRHIKCWKREIIIPIPYENGKSRKFLSMEQITIVKQWKCFDKYFSESFLFIIEKFRNCLIIKLLTKCDGLYETWNKTKNYI